MDELQRENAELRKQLEELRFQVGANLEIINFVVSKTHELLSEQPSCDIAEQAKIQVLNCLARQLNLRDKHCEQDKKQ